MAAPDGPAPTTDTQYRIGSISKTFVGVEVMRLRDEGRLDLGDTIGAHLPEVPFPQVTVAQLLTHTSGLQAETDGDWWERTEGGSWSTLLAADPGCGPRRAPGSTTPTSASRCSASSSRGCGTSRGTTPCAWASSNRSA